MRHTAIDLRAEVRHVGELVGIVGWREDRLADILADLVLIDIEGGGKFDIVNVVATQVDMHQAWHEIFRLSIFVVLDALYQRTGAVPDADNCNAYFLLVGHIRCSLILSLGTGYLLFTHPST